MPVQKYPYKVTKIDWYDYISRGESNISYSFFIHNPNDSMYSTASGSMFFIYFIEKNSGRIYITEPDIMPFDVNETNVKVICQFNIPFNLLPGVYCVQLKTRHDIGGPETTLNSIPTLQDELQFTIVDTPNLNIKIDGLIQDGTVLTDDDIKWKEDHNENN